MSLCRGRLFFNTKSERRRQDLCVAQTLNFHDSDGDEDGDQENRLETIPEAIGIQDSPELKTPPCSPTKKHRYMTFGSPTPKSPDTSPRFRRSFQSPMTFPYDSDVGVITWESDICSHSTPQKVQVVTLI